MTEGDPELLVGVEAGWTVEVLYNFLNLSLFCSWFMDSESEEYFGFSWHWVHHFGERSDSLASNNCN